MVRNCFFTPTTTESDLILPAPFLESSQIIVVCRRISFPLSCVDVVDCAFILFLLAFCDGEIISNYRESRWRRTSSCASIAEMRKKLWLWGVKWGWGGEGLRGVWMMEAWNEALIISRLLARPSVVSRFRRFFHLFLLLPLGFDFLLNLPSASERDLSSRIGYLAAFGPI